MDRAAAIRKLIKIAQVAAFVTPNPIDDQVLAFLKILADNENVMNFFLSMLDKLAHRGHSIGDQDLEAIFIETLIDKLCNKS